MSGLRAASAGMARMLETYPVGQAGRERCREAIAVGDAIAAPRLAGSDAAGVQEPARDAGSVDPGSVDLCRGGLGRGSRLDSILETHQSIWGDRYARWDQMTPHEKLSLTVEGMRGGHFSGPRRRGDLLLVDKGIGSRMIMQPCGSGGVLRARRSRNRPAALSHRCEHGVNQEPHLWTWQKTGIHWYCAHCCISMEWLPGRKRGRPLRPLDHVSAQRRDRFSGVRAARRSSLQLRIALRAAASL